MNFVGAALDFPAVVFSFALVVVIGYWVLVLLGGLGFDVLDGDDGSDLLDGLGLGGVPATVVLSLMIAVAWFVSLAGTVLLDRADVPAVVVALLSIAVLLVALVCAWGVARLVVLPLRRMLPAGPQASRADFVGRTCVIRTGRVDAGFGQAEVTAADGSSAIVQVRQNGADPLTAGTSALIYDYDPDGEFFWVAAMPALDPTDQPRKPATPEGVE
jgi:hypothetical protein